ncbi:MAG: DUF2851 family protein [Chitinophagales bacterium]
MTEKLLQFIWQLGYFNHAELRVVSGEDIQILDPGAFNNNQGPDFLEAKISIGSTIWVGHIEIHLLSSDWFRHAHDQDRNYGNVILHVVWEDDQPVKEMQFPLLVLQDRIPKLLLEKYEGWMDSRSFIPCEKNIRQINSSTWYEWTSRLTLERLNRKSNKLKEELAENNAHWEEICWWQIAASFGNKVNTAAFEALAKTLPILLLGRHKNQIFQLEALLMGQGGLLDKEFLDEYPRQLKKEYLFLKTKYNLKPSYHSLHFLRMRPGNFPTLRLSQLANLISQSLHLFSKIREEKELKQIKSWLAVDSGNYWNTHYVPDEVSTFKIKSLGTQVIESIIINAIIPMLFAYGSMHEENEYIEKAISWLSEMGPENNSIIEHWKRIGLNPQNASQTQALLELKNLYCEKKRCLNCAIGETLLKNSMDEGSLIKC